MGEKPIRGLKKAAWQGTAPQTSMKLLQHVKVYRLEDNGKWDDQGMGHVTIDYMEGSGKIALVVVDEEDYEILVLHNITPDNIYRKQETIISWRDPEKALELALSFQGPAGCSYIWENMCNIWEDLQSKILRPHEVPNSALKSLDASRDSQLHDKSVNGELKKQPLEFLSSKRRKYSQPPPLELSGLFAILKTVQTILKCGKMEQMRGADSTSKDEEGGAAFQQVPDMVPSRPMTLDELPPELREEVVKRLPCRADRARLRCCNSLWKDSIKNCCEPLQLPWLLLPSTVDLLYYSVTGERFRNYRPIPIEIQNAQFAGASDGDWLFLVSDNPRGHHLFHLFSGWSIPLPTAMMMEARRVDVTVVSAVLSGDPSFGGFSVAAIVDVGELGNKRAAFWQENTVLWGDCGNVALQRAGDLVGADRYLPLDMELVDLVHINGTFWFLTSEEELVRLIPTEDLNGQLRMVARGLNVQVRDDYEPEEELDEDEVFEQGKGELIRRYLVESSGQPIMVLRNIEGHWTVGLRLFRLQSDGDNAWWDELFELPGETLFIGHGCSRSYRIGQELLKIYFFHDRITTLGGRNLYWRTDNGVATEIGVLEWPVLLWDGVPVPAASDRAPPTWLLH